MAIIDRREIEFDAEGVLQVLGSAALRADALGLPSLRPTQLVFMPEKSCAKLVYGSGLGARFIELPAEALGSLLVSHCVRTRIPMPRRAGKSIRVERNCVILAFRSVAGPAADPGPASRGEAVRGWSWGSEPEGSSDPARRAPAREAPQG